MNDTGLILFITITNCTINFFFCFLVIFLLSRFSFLGNPRLRYSLFCIPLIKLWFDFFSGIFTRHTAGILQVDLHATDLCLSMGFGSSGVSLWSLIFSCLIGQQVCSLGDLALLFAGETPALAITALWAVTALILIAGRFIHYFSFLTRVRSRGISNDRLDRAIREACGSLSPLPAGILSDDTASPMAAGFIRPFIVLPARLIERLTDEELSLIVRHEAGHIHRHDNIMNLVVAMTMDIFFFLLPLRLLEKEISCERERISDRYALENLEARAIPFAKALVKVVEFGIMQRTPSMVSGMSTLSGDKKAVFRRVKELLSPDITRPEILGHWCVHGPITLILLKLLIGASIFASSGSLQSTTYAAVRIIVSA